MKIDLKHRKTFVCGATGSGKTYMVEHFLIKQFKHPMVYLIHQEDFTSCKNNVNVYVPKNNGLIDTSMEHLEAMCIWFKKLAQDGKIDALIIDESDMFIPKDQRTLQRYPHLYDLLINHRHYGKEKGQGLALIFIARRPQEMSTVFIEQAHCVILFALDGKNVKEHFASFHADYEELIPQLKMEKHNFIVKMIGQPPVLYDGIQLKGVK